jgi:hypothetical protein
VTCNPLGSRIARHADANRSSSRVPKNDQAVEQLERDRSHLEEIKRSDAGDIKAVILKTLDFSQLSEFSVGTGGR